MNVRILSAISFTLIAVNSLAQAPQITAVWPPGGQRGTTVSARIEGAALAGATVVLISAGGIKLTQEPPAKDGNTLPIKLIIDAKAGPGPYEVRVITPKGISNPGYIYTGNYPEIAEVEPNSLLDSPMKLDKTPITVYGRMDAAEDVDWFSFVAGAGETIVADICAFRIFSPLDPAIELRDPKGRLVASAMEGYDRDPRIIFTVKTSGLHKLQVRDTLYRGGPNYIYKLTIGNIPVVTTLTPNTGKRGAALNSVLQGANLGGSATWTTNLPPDMRANRPIYVFPETANGPALPAIVTGDDVDTLDLRPGSNSAIGMGAGSSAKSVFGRLDSAKQKDAFIMSADAGKVVQITVRSREIGSRLYPFLRILDSSGKELLNTDETTGRDPSISFSPPTTGSYTLEVTSADSHGGPEYYYSIALIPSAAAPTFGLTAQPDIAGIGKGQTVAITVNVARRGTAKSEINVHVEGGPPGLQFSKLTIGADQNSGLLTATAPAGVAISAGQIHVIGEATIGGKAERKEAQLIATLPRPGEGQLVSRFVDFGGLATTDAVPLFTLAPEMTVISLKQGQSVQIKVKVTRKPGDNNANPAIALTLPGLSGNINADLPGIPEKGAEVTIKILVGADTPVGKYSAVLTGKLGNDIQVAPAFAINVLPK